MLLHHAGALFYLLSACVNSNSNLNSFALKEEKWKEKENPKPKLKPNPVVHFSHSAQLPCSNQSPPHFSPAAQPKPPAQTSSTQPGPLPLSRGPVSPARSHGFSFLLGLSFPLRPSVRPPLHSACSALRDAPSLRGPLNRSAQRVALPAPLQPGPTRQLHPLARASPLNHAH